MASAKTRKEKKATYQRWKWVGEGTQNRALHGEMIGRSKTDVLDQLAKQRIKATKIQRKSHFTRRGKVTNTDVMIFARLMATMIRAGIPVIQALQAVAESLKKPAMVAVIQQLVDDVSAGDSLSDALAKHPKHFDQLFVNLVSAGEQAGALDQMLERVASYKEKIESLKSRVKKALWYPAAVISVGIAVTVLLLIMVVPEFESMFNSFGTELPAPTRIVVNLSELVQQYWLFSLGTMLASIGLLTGAVRRSPAVAYKRDKLMLRIPILGDILDKSAVSRFTRTLATTFSAGVPLIEGLDTAAKAAGNRVYNQAINEVGQDVASGQQLYFAMRMTNRFPPLAVQMVSIGEEAGAVDSMLNRVANYYEEEVENKVDALTSLMEPIIIVVLGVLVGGIVIAMYLPFMAIGNAF